MSGAIIITGILILIVGCFICGIITTMSKPGKEIRNFLCAIIPTAMLAISVFGLGCSVSSYRELWLRFKYDDVRVFDYIGDQPVDIDELKVVGYTAAYKENYRANSFGVVREYTMLYMVKAPVNVNDEYKKLVEK